MKIKLLLTTVICVFGLLSAACPSRTSIAKIEANPSKYANKEVAVAGRVTNSFGIPLLGGVYKLDDGTGSIWVLTKRGVPAKDAEVGVKGKLQNGVNFNGKGYGLGIIEDERRTR